MKSLFVVKIKPGSESFAKLGACIKRVKINIVVLESPPQPFYENVILTQGGSHSTCWRLDPDFACFGSFTPAFPLPTFTELISARESDFLRVNWRNGRSSNVCCLGRPMQEGCFLAVKRTAVQLPDGKKLAWILRVNGEIVTMVDSQNNKLV